MRGVTWFDIEVGRLLFQNIRDLLEDEKFKGRAIEWREGSGFFVRTFTVRGNPEDLAIVKERIDRTLPVVGWGNEQ